MEENNENTESTNEEQEVVALNSDENNVAHQQSLVKDSFSTIERLEVEMSDIENEFKSLNTENK